MKICFAKLQSEYMQRVRLFTQLHKYGECQIAASGRGLLGSICAVQYNLQRGVPNMQQQKIRTGDEI